MILYRPTLILFAGICAFTSTPLAGAAEMPLTITDCREINSAVARLDCYDRAVDAQQSLADDPPAEVVAPVAAAKSSTPPSTAATSAAATSAAADAPTTEISPEALFGKNVVEVQKSVQKVTGTKDIDRLEAFVSNVRSSANGKAIITLDNGQVWAQIDNSRLRLSSYDRVVIRKASLGSFMLAKVGRKTTMRVKRIS